MSLASKIAARNTSINTTSEKTTSNNNGAGKMILDKLNEQEKLFSSLVNSVNDNKNRMNAIERTIMEKIAELARIQVKTISSIEEIRSLLQSNSNVKPGNVPSVFKDSGINGNKSDTSNKGIGTINLAKLDINAIMEVTNKEVKNGNGKLVLEKLFKDHKTFSDEPDFTALLKEVWKNEPNYTSLISLRNINEFCKSVWKQIKDISPKGNDTVLKKASNTEDVSPSAKYFADAFKIDVSKIQELKKTISETMDTSNLVKGKYFDNEDREYILKEALGKDISNCSGTDAFLTSLISVIKPVPKSE